ncbi:MAG: hypothetical protein JO087_07395, partial [Actinobacteria bacterium]|nr:hypothetical protein [Actinomycetota bacterium]
MDPEPRNGHPDGSDSRSDGPAPETPISAQGRGSPTQPGPSPISRRRLVAVNSLVGVTTLLLVVAIFSIWANRLLFSPDNWSNASSQLLTNPDVRSGTANYLVDQLYANVNVAGVIKSGLPTRLQPLAGPAAGALRNVAVQGVELALTRPRIQSLWAKANRAADQTFIAVVKGGKGPVGVKQGVVSLNLASIIGDVASRLGLPRGITSKLPPNIANLTVFKSSQLKVLQNGGNAIQGLALWLTIIVPVLYGLALLLARGHRRRTLMTIGFAGVAAGVVGLLGRSILESQITSSLTNDTALRPAIRATIGIGTELLSQVSGAVIAIAAALIVAAWFAGPAGIARTTRQAITPFLRDRPVATYATTLGMLLLIFVVNPIPATGKLAGIIVFTLLALIGTEVLRRQAMREFPDARAGAATAAIRARLQAFRAPRTQGEPVRPPAPGNSI